MWLKLEPAVSMAALRRISPHKTMSRPRRLTHFSCFSSERQYAEKIEVDTLYKNQTTRLHASAHQSSKELFVPAAMRIFFSKELLIPLLRTSVRKIMLIYSSLQANYISAFNASLRSSGQLLTRSP